MKNAYFCCFNTWRNNDFRKISCTTLTTLKPILNQREANLYRWQNGFKKLTFQVLNFDSPRGGISLEIEKTRTGTTSKLLVTRAMPSDSGSYTCNPSRGQSTSADVHVITGTLSLTPYLPICLPTDLPKATLFEVGHLAYDKVWSSL